VNAQRVGGFDGRGSDIEPIEVIGDKSVAGADDRIIAGQRRQLRLRRTQDGGGW
jgi:hypothetical protein